MFQNTDSFEQIRSNKFRWLTINQLKQWFICEYDQIALYGQFNQTEQNTSRLSKWLYVQKIWMN